RSASGVSNALASLVTAYNAAMDELAKSHGENANALAGQSIVSTVESALRTLGHYSTDSGSIPSLSVLGLNFDTKGHLALDTSAFSSATGHFSDLATFLGSSETSGF